MYRILLVAAASLLLLASSTLAQNGNHPNASLVVNANSVGQEGGLQALVGTKDPNLVSIQGQPDSLVILLVGTYNASGFELPAYGTLHIDPSRGLTLINLRLDATGNLSILIPPGLLEGIANGATLGIQAAVADLSMSSGFRLSGGTLITFIPTMSSDIDALMPVGSVARIRGPVLSVSPTGISVANVQFAINAETEFANGGSVGAISVGDWVVIAGGFTATGSLIANEIGVEDAEPMVRVTGRIQGIGPSGVVLLGVSVFVSDATTYADQGAPSSFAAVELGTPVDVFVPIAMEGFPAVQSMDLNVRVEVEVEVEPEPEPEPEPEDEDPAPPMCS